MRYPRIVRGLLLAGTAALLAAGIFSGAALVAAQEDGSPTPAPGSDERAHRGPGPLAEAQHHCRALPLLKALVEQSALEPAVVREALAEGSTLGEVLEANGVDAEAVKASALEQVDVRLDKAVANGRLTGERAEAILARTEAVIDRLLHDPGPRFGHGTAPRNGAPTPSGEVEPPPLRCG